jgi:hypothetical protein
MEFKIAMGTGGKTAKELTAIRNRIARNLWMAKTKTCIAQTFPIDSDYVVARTGRADNVILPDVLSHVFAPLLRISIPGTTCTCK